MNEKTNGILDRLDKIENILCNLNLNEMEESSKNYKTLEIYGDWEPYVDIEINDKRFLSYCDIGSMMSTMPRMVFDTMNFGDLDRKSTRLNSSHRSLSRMPSSA